MQTNFTADQLRDPQIAEADAILKTCVHYGFCTNTCPTYVLMRDENDSPRGRIDLIRAMLEKGGRARAEDRPSSRPLPLVPVLHDDLRGEGRLRASDRPRPRAYRAAISAGRRPSGWCARCSRACCRIRAFSARRWRSGAWRSRLRPLLPRRLANDARHDSVAAFAPGHPRAAGISARKARCASAWRCSPAARSRRLTATSTPRRSGCCSGTAARW